MEAKLTGIDHVALTTDDVYGMIEKDILMQQYPLEVALRMRRTAEASRDTHVNKYLKKHDDMAAILLKSE